MMRYARLLMGIWRNESRSCTVYHLSKSCHIYRQQLQVSQVQVCQQSSAQAKEPEQQLVTTRTAANDGNSHTNANIFHSRTHSQSFVRVQQCSHQQTPPKILSFSFCSKQKHITSSALKLGTEPQVLGGAVFPRKTATFVASQKRRVSKN